MPSDNPTTQVISMIQKGMSNDQIVQTLKSQNYSYQQIAEAIHQAETKSSIDPTSFSNPSSQELQPSIMHEQSAQELPEAPSPSNHSPQPAMIYPSTPQQSFFESRSQSMEQFEEIAEAIIEEKWRQSLQEFGDLSAFRERIRSDIASLKQELLRVERRFENLQSAVLGKVQDYDKSITDVGTNIKALEKLLQNIIQPLTSNIKELQRLTQDLKSK